MKVYLPFEFDILKVGTAIVEIDAFKLSARFECCILKVGNSAVEFGVSEIGLAAELGISKVKIPIEELSARECDRLVTMEFRAGEKSLSTFECTVLKKSLPLEFGLMEIGIATEQNIFEPCDLVELCL